MGSAIFESTGNFFVACRSALCKLMLALAVCLISRPAPAIGGRGAGQSPSAQYWPDRVIVKFATGAVIGPQRAALQAFAPQGGAPLAEILAGFGAAETAQLFPPNPELLQKKSADIDLSSIYEIRFAQPVPVMKVVHLLRQQPEVVYAEPAYIRRVFYSPNDPLLNFQQHLNVIKAREAWDVTKGDTSVVIAIIDTGVDWPHDDLKASIWRNYKEIPNNGIDDDKNGYVDDVRGWDFGGLGGSNQIATPDNDPREDRPEHGTLVAGIAAAPADNGIGVAGVGFKCKIMPVKVSQNNFRSDDGSALIVYGYAGIRYAAENGAHVINCSWGGEGASQMEQEVIDYVTRLGALVVAAAGNGSSNAPGFPAAYRNVVAVAATENSDVRAGYSSYGYWVDVSAPGNNVYSAWQPNNYAYGTAGTSFSSPIVAGLAALVKSAHKDWTPTQIAEQIRLAADNIDGKNASQYARQLGYGRVNAQRAVSPTFKTPAVRLASYSMREAVGDQDGIFEAGEEIAATFKLANVLEPVSNLSATLTETSPFVNVLSPAKTVSAIGRGDTVTVSGTFNFRIEANVPANHLVTFYLNFSAAGYNDWQGFTAVLRPLYADLAAGNAATTITSFGALGFEDYARSAAGGHIGRGFEFPIGSASALYHGGLILATAANRVSDVTYGNSAYDRFDFVTATGGELGIKPGKKATVEATARFNDSAAESPIGLTVDQKAYAWANEPWNDFVILEYTIRNTTAQALNNLYAGFYLDWDIADAQKNQAGWDNANQVGYEWGPGSAYYGITAILPAKAHTYRAVKNPDFVWNNQFTDATKYQFLIETFQVLNSDVPHDWSQLLGYGPYNLAAGQSVTVAFAILGGTNLADLQANANAARGAYLTTGVDEAPADPVPLQFALAQSAPNPFAIKTAPAAEIRYSLAKPGPVTLRIFNLLGQEVAVLVSGVQNPGSYTAQWNGRDRRGLAVPSGVYFYQLKTPSFTATRKLIVVE
jgi:subtilisin family serine protease